MTIGIQPAGRVYRAARGAGFTDKQAHVYGTYLEQKVGLGERPVTPEEIVDAARPSASPIHEAFTWDDTDAAEKWRISEARTLVNHIVVSTATPDGESGASSRAFHSVVTRVEPDEDEGEDGKATTTRGYVAATVVWEDPGYSQQVVNQALRELRGWRDRYGQYADLQHHVAVISDLLGGDGDVTE